MLIALRLSNPVLSSARNFVIESPLSRRHLLILNSLTDIPAYIKLRAPAVIMYGESRTQWDESGLIKE